MEHEPTIRFLCPECGKRLKTASEHVGKPAKCPRCGARLRVGPVASKADGAMAERIAQRPLSTGVSVTSQPVKSTDSDRTPKDQPRPAESACFRFEAVTRPFAGRKKRYTVQLGSREMTIAPEHDPGRLVVPRQEVGKMLKVRMMCFRVLGDRWCTFYPRSKPGLVTQAIWDWSRGRSPGSVRWRIGDVLADTHALLRPACIAVYALFWIACANLLFSVLSALFGFEKPWVAVVQVFACLFCLACCFSALRGLQMRLVGPCLLLALSGFCTMLLYWWWQPTSQGTLRTVETTVAGFGFAIVTAFVLVCTYSMVRYGIQRLRGDRTTATAANGSP
jgi:DNA-directed RNA polymerase subunit RPC12/RpoP